MNAAEHLIKTLEQLPKLMPRMFDAIIKDNIEELEDLNAEQLELGEDAKMDSLAKYRNPDYARMKKAIGSLSSPVADLKLTGEYHRDIKVVSKGLGKFQYINTNEKFDWLTKKYPDHLGASLRSKEIIAEDILQPEMKEEIETWINSNMIIGK